MDKRNRHADLGAPTAILRRGEATPGCGALADDGALDRPETDTHAALPFSVELPSRRWLEQATHRTS